MAMDRFISDQMPSVGLPLCLDRWTGVCEHAVIGREGLLRLVDGLSRCGLLCVVDDATEI